MDYKPSLDQNDFNSLNDDLEILREPTDKQLRRIKRQKHKPDAECQDRCEVCNCFADLVNGLCESCADDVNEAA